MNAKHPSTVPSAVYKVRAFTAARRHLREQTGGPSRLTWGRQGAVWVMSEYPARSGQGHCARVVTEQGRPSQQSQRPSWPPAGWKGQDSGLITPRGPGCPESDLGYSRQWGAVLSSPSSSRVL